MKIYLGTDHAGFELKEKLKTWLKESGHQVLDEGAFELDSGDDYPDFMKIVGKLVASDPENSRGIILGGSGQGEAICVNRYRGIRAVVYYGGPLEIIKFAREHNNANVLSLGTRFLKEEEAKKAIALWLTTRFPAEERHVRRLVKIDLPDETAAAGDF